MMYFSNSVLHTGPHLEAERSRSKPWSRYQCFSYYWRTCSGNGSFPSLIIWNRLQYLSDDQICFPTAHYLGNLQEKHQSSSVQERVGNASIEIKYLWTLVRRCSKDWKGGIKWELIFFRNKINSYMWLQCLVLKNGLEPLEWALIRIEQS